MAKRSVSPWAGRTYGRCETRSWATPRFPASEPRIPLAADPVQVEAGKVPTYLSQRGLPSYDDRLPESEEVSLGGSQGGHVREIAAGHPTSNQPGPVPITYEEPSRCGQGSGSPLAENPTRQMEAAYTARPRPADRSVEAEKRLLLDPPTLAQSIRPGWLHSALM